LKVGERGGLKRGKKKVNVAREKQGLSKTTTIERLKRASLVKQM